MQDLIFEQKSWKIARNAIEILGISSRATFYQFMFSWYKI